MPNTRLILGFVGAALAGPAAFAQSWDDKVTVATGARPVGEVVAELSKASGMAMSVEGLAKNDIIFINIKDVPVRIVAEKIATATGSRWVDENGVYKLQRTEADERKQWSDDAKVRKVEIENAIAETLKRFEDRNQAAARQGNGSNNQYQNAGMRAVLALLQLVSSEQLAALEPDERVVFASRTTPMQRPLPSGGNRIAQQYLVDDIAWHQWSLERSRSQDQANGRQNRGAQQTEANLNRLRNVRIGKSLLIIQNQGGTMIARLDLVDTAGGLISSANVAIQSERGRPNQNSNNPGGEPLKYSDKATALASLWRQNQTFNFGGNVQLTLGTAATVEGSGISFEVAGQEDVTPEKIEEAIRAMAARPDLNEPLDFFVAELLRLAAESEKAGIVACIPDSAMQPSALAVLGNHSGKKIWAELKNLQMTAVLEDGIYVVSPRLQSLSRYERMNRPAAAALVASAAKKGYASLDDLGEYAGSSSRGAFTGPLDSRLVAIAHPEAGNALRRNSGNQEALAIFASLGQHRRDEMARTRSTVPISSTSAADEARWLTYNSMDGPVWRNPQQRRGNGRDRNTQESQMREVVLTNIAFTVGSPADGGSFQGAQGQVYQERTELLPNGVPAASTVSLTTQVESLLRSSENQDQTARTTMLSPEALGAHRAQRDSPAFADSRAQMPDYRVFSTAEQGTFTITITYSDNYTMTRVLREVKVSPENKPMAYADLPPDIRKRVDDSYNRTYEAIKNSRNGRGGGNNRGTPPP